MKHVLTYAYDLNKKNIKEYTEGFSIEGFYSPSKDKEISEIGLIYITPYQVMAAQGVGFHHDPLVECIQNIILDGKPTSRIFLRCYRVIYEGHLEDAYAWSFGFMHKKNDYDVTEITREMYDIALGIEKAIEVVMKSNGVQLDKDICGSLKQIIIENRVSVIEDKRQLCNNQVETIYGYKLSEYSSIIKRIIEERENGIAH